MFVKSHILTIHRWKSFDVFSLLLLRFSSLELGKGSVIQFKKKKTEDWNVLVSVQGILPHCHFSYALPLRYKIPIMVGLNYRKQCNENNVLSCRFSHSLCLFVKNPVFVCNIYSLPECACILQEVCFQYVNCMYNYYLCVTNSCWVITHF